VRRPALARLGPARLALDDGEQGRDVLQPRRFGDAPRLQDRRLRSRETPNCRLPAEHGSG